MQLILSNVLLKVRMGICDKEVLQALQSRVQPRNIDDIQLDRTVVICSTRAECDEINEQCLERVQGNPVSYKAIASFEQQRDFAESLQKSTVHPTLGAADMLSSWVTQPSYLPLVTGTSLEHSFGALSQC